MQLIWTNATLPDDITAKCLSLVRDKVGLIVTSFIFGNVDILLPNYYIIPKNMEKMCYNNQFL